MVELGKHSGNAYAKINLSLDILDKMDDGYHSLKTVMQTVGLADVITVECEAAPAETLDGGEPENENSMHGCDIVVDTGLSYIPTDGRNIAAKAAGAFFGHTGITCHKVEIRIEKKIPVCAGLGGGSADAACVLRMLDKIFGTALGRAALEKLGRKVGADVPFCIGGGTRLAEGRGEILTDLPPIPPVHIVICKPPFHCSTPELFGRVNCKKIRTRPDTDGLLAAIGKKDVAGIARRMYNVFEDVLPQGIKSEIDSIKAALLECGALGAAMTGSGPSVIGLFDGMQSAQGAYGRLSYTYKECFLTQPV